MTNVLIGGGSGIGRAVAVQLAPRGRLLLANRSRESVKAVALGFGGAIETMACDVTNRDQIKALFERVDDLDALIVTARHSTLMAEVLFQHGLGDLL